jgi:hypothetical protein
MLPTRTQWELIAPSQGFGRFIDGKPADKAQHTTCFPCHRMKREGHDFVFTRVAP